MTATNRPRKFLMSTAAVLVPLIALVGASFWFVRTYVLPPTVTITPPAAAFAVATPAVTTPESETTGSSASSEAPVQPSQPTVRYTTDSAEVWAAVPLPGPPRVTAPEPQAAAEPVKSPVPLPPRRPRLTDNDTGRTTPVPRPRPTN